MSKLVAEKGRIFKVTAWVAGPMDVTFKAAAIAPDGDLGQVHLKVGESEVKMTYAQAISLANVLLQRCQA